jgi:hypothetical protein
LQITTPLIQKQGKSLDTAITFLSTKDPLSFQAVTAMNPESSSASEPKDISLARDEVDEIIAARGGLTPDERDYYSIEHGIVI